MSKSLASQTGYVSVLRSLSDDPQIADVPDLYKIGFSRGPVEKRIARAEYEPTYLMGPAEIQATARTTSRPRHSNISCTGGSPKLSSG